MRLALYGCFFAVLSWASWHWWGDFFTFAVLMILVLCYMVDNIQLRRQIQCLLAERDQRERKQALQDVAGSLSALRDKKRAGVSRPK
ncbi:hypothetical protein [Duganella sp.]|uniref:hypothetical protein n=1 Tax=Duganella sp. TaxID=1904440 RepID=UPI0031DC4A3F